MINISKKTLQDLEYESVILQIAAHNVTTLGKSEVLNTVPFSKRDDVINRVQKLRNILKIEEEIECELISNRVILIRKS